MFEMLRVLLLLLLLPLLVTLDPGAGPGQFRWLAISSPCNRECWPVVHTAGIARVSLRWPATSFGHVARSQRRDQHRQLYVCEERNGETSIVN